MAETEKRKAQDIGQDEAYIVNLKDVVENTKDTRGRSRVYFDALACNLVVSMGAINSQIARMVTQGATAYGKTAENIIGVNETDHVVSQILNSPWAEALKTIVVEVMAETQKKK
jgi:hypothetical protein